MSWFSRGSRGSPEEEVGHSSISKSPYIEKVNFTASKNVANTLRVFDKSFFFPQQKQIPIWRFEHIELVCKDYLAAADRLAIGQADV